MNLFQNKIVEKYISAASEKIKVAYQAYSSCFHNPDIQENIRNSKEEQFQEGFLRELFVKVLGYTLNPAPNYNHYIANYESVKTANSKNLYTLFNEKACSLIKDKGFVSYIVPEGFLKTRSYADCVKAMEQVGTITKAVYFDDWVFEDATTGSMIFEYVKDKSTGYIFEEYRFDRAKQIAKVENTVNPIFEKYNRLKVGNHSASP